MAVLSGEKPDRVPIFECLIHDDVLERFGGSRIAVGDFPAMVQACAKCLDLCHPVLVPQEPKRTELGNGGVSVIERWTMWYFAGKPLKEEEIKAALTGGIESAEAWRPADGDRAAFRQRADSTNQLADGMVYIHFAIVCPLLPFNLEQGFLAWMEHRALVDRWNQAERGKQLRYIDSIAEGAVAPVAIVFDDIACKNRLMYPPALLEEYLYPHLSEVVDLLHSRGVRVVFHSDGDVTPALRRLSDCGIDGFNPLEISAGMTPEKFREICGRRVALVGGIDAVDVLAHGTPQRVAQETRRLIDMFREEGNLIVASASGEVDNGMPTENVLAMYETTWEQGVY